MLTILPMLTERMSDVVGG